jgi:hypothetical protein
MSHSADNYKKIKDVLATLTDITGFDFSKEHNRAFNDAYNEILNLIALIENAECQKGRDEMAEEIQEILDIPFPHSPEVLIEFIKDKIK